MLGKILTVATLVAGASGSALAGEPRGPLPEARLVLEADAGPPRALEPPVPRTPQAKAQAKLQVKVPAKRPPSPQRALLTQRVPLAFQGDADGAQVAKGASLDGALEVTVKLERPDGATADELTVEAVWRKRAWVHLAAIELSFPGGKQVTVAGRDLHAAALAVGRTAYLERFDPKWVRFQRGDGPVTLTVDDGLDGVIVRPAAAGLEVRLELDSADARPFLHDARCTKQWRAPNQHLPVRSRLRVPDERALARAELYPGDALPLWKAHWPDGRQAALAITDHADQTSGRTLEALTRALAEHKLVITKALFAHGSDRPQLEDPRVAKLADELAQAGTEIVPHSATPRPDPRPVTEAALTLFQRWNTRTWIDHQPETNCEAFGDQGYRVGGKFGIADLLVAHRYEYVWAEVDAPPEQLNLLPTRLDQRAPTVWPVGRLDLGGPDGIWMFRTVWAFLEARRFYRMYSAAALDRLERERGLHVAHTYLETYHPRRSVFGLRNLFVPADPRKDLPGGKGPVKLDPRFTALLDELERRQERGSLWVPTLGALADRLRGVAELSVRFAADGSAVVSAPRPIAGATFVVPRADLRVLLAGHEPKGARVGARETVFWDDLPEGTTTITLTDGAGNPVPFVAQPSVSASPSSSARIWP